MRSEKSYEAVLKAHPRVANFADDVLQKVARFSHLHTAEEIQRELRKRRSTSPHTGPAPAEDLQMVVVRKLAPPELDEMSAESMALACRAAELTLGQTPRHHQIVCAAFLTQGRIIEMPNGAGKTLAAALACALTAARGLRTHVVTANDYLSERDARWMGPILKMMGFSVGVGYTSQTEDLEYGILGEDGKSLRVKLRPGSTLNRDNPFDSLAGSSMEDAEKLPPPEVSDFAEKQIRHQTLGEVELCPGLTEKQVFESDVIYSRIDFFCFAHLRDFLKFSPVEQVMTQRDLLIVDECDAVLIDDLQVPTMLTSPTGLVGGLPREDLVVFHQIAERLTPYVHFRIAGQSLSLTYEGVEAIRAMLGVDAYLPEHAGWANAMCQALRAIHLFHPDQHYIVRDGRVILIDPASGRILHGRRLANGLHEAIEAKENVTVIGEAGGEVVARITLKHFVAAYRTVSGMSGTIGSVNDYLKFYGLSSVALDPEPTRRVDHPDLIFRTKKEADRNALNLALELAEAGRPVLLNVPTVRDVYRFAQAIQTAGWKNFQALDAETAQTFSEEARCLGRAGQKGFITVCSKIAARGADIKLSPETMNTGLYVIGVERGRDRRYDHQLQGRAGRHGNPGDSRFFVSLEDELMRAVAADAISGVLRSLGMDEDVPIESPFVARQIAGAQRRIQLNENEYRVQVVDNDDIVARHRLVFYALRQKILTRANLMPELDIMVDNWLQFHGRAIVDIKSQVFGKSADTISRLGRVGRFFEQIEIDRILQVRKRQQRLEMLGSTLKSKVQGSTLALMDSGQRNSVLRSAILSFLDARWKDYFSFEGITHDEMLLGWPDPSALERYASKMEDHFDSFFHDVGEKTIEYVLGTVSWHAPELATGAS